MNAFFKAVEQLEKDPLRQKLLLKKIMRDPNFDSYISSNFEDYKERLLGPYILNKT